MEIKNPSQEQRILNYIEEHGSIDRLRAAYDLGIFELSARLKGLESKGHVFGKKRKVGKSKYGNTFSCIEYSLKPVDPHAIINDNSVVTQLTTVEKIFKKVKSWLRKTTIA